LRVLERQCSNSEVPLHLETKTTKNNEKKLLRAWTWVTSSSTFFIPSRYSCARSAFLGRDKGTLYLKSWTSLRLTDLPSWMRASTWPY
jgi:hypothetical protein